MYLFDREDLMFVNALTWLRSLRDCDDGVTAIEYGLIAALIAVAIIAAITVVGTELNSTFQTIRGSLANANGS